MESHESDTTESAYCDAEGEDPNDPEWTVADDRDADKDRIRPTNKRQGTATLRRHQYDRAILTLTLTGCLSIVVNIRCLLVM